LAQGGELIELTAGAQSFAFPVPLPAGSRYQLSIVSQPAAQTCEIDQASGDVIRDLADRILVRCQSTPGRLSGTISGLSAPGLELASGAELISVPMGASSFRFETPIAAGSPFLVEISKHPAAQFCSLTQGSGTMLADGVNTVQVNCSANAYTLGGTVRGLSAAGLVLNEGGEMLSLPPSASSFQFANRRAFGSAYSVAIASQPAGLYCSLADSAGVVGLTSVQSIDVSCAPSERVFRVGGTVSGLDAEGLALRMGAETLRMSVGASSCRFDNPVADTGRYVVSIDTQPESSSCSLAQPAGTIEGADISTVAVTCRNKTLYAVAAGAIAIVDTVTGQTTGVLRPGGPYSALATVPRSPYVLVAENLNQVLHVIDDRTRQLAQGSPVPIGAEPAAVVIDPSGTRAYVIDERAAAVSVLDMTDSDLRRWAIISRIPVGSGPVAAHASASRPYLYVLNRAERSVSVIHTGSLSVVRTYAGIGAAPSAITGGPGDAKLYIADEGARTLITLDVTTGEANSRVLDITRGVLARSPDGRRIFLLNEQYTAEDLMHQVTRLDTLTNQLTSTVIAESPISIAISPGGGRLYSADVLDPAGATVIDAGTGSNQMTILRRIPMSIVPFALVVK